MRLRSGEQVPADGELLTADGLEIDIADDGRGAGPVPSAGNGLVNCRRRAELIGGSFHVEPRATGFAQRLAVPIRGVATAAP